MPKGYKNIGDGLYINKGGKIYSERVGRFIAQKPRAVVNYYGTSVAASHIIAMHYCEKPLNATEVHHKDGNPANNAASNLMWVTKEQHKEIHRRMRQAMQKYFSNPKHQRDILENL